MQEVKCHVVHLENYDIYELKINVICKQNTFTLKNVFKNFSLMCTLN